MTDQDKPEIIDDADLDAAQGAGAPIKRIDKSSPLIAAKDDDGKADAEACTLTVNVCHL